MRIQSVQNQQTQSRQNFSASATIMTKLPQSLDGLVLGSPILHLENESLGVINLLKHLSVVFRNFVRTEAPKESLTKDTVSHFVSEISGNALLIKSIRGSEQKPFQIRIDHSDGSEIILTRQDYAFSDSPVSETDKLFDDAAAILDAKVKPLILPTAEERQLTERAEMALLGIDNPLSKI